MSFQLLLQGKISGIDDFLASAPQSGDSDLSLLGRGRWISLLGEVLPRALLAELGLAKILLGSSGGGQFLVVVPGENRAQVEQFLTSAAAQIRDFSSGKLALFWSITENLGDWVDIRKRLNDELSRKMLTPLGAMGLEAFEAFDAHPGASGEYFSGLLGAGLGNADGVGWSPEEPARITLEGGKHRWSLRDDLAMARHTAPGASETLPATLGELSERAAGAAAWGMLRGDVDDFLIRLRRAQSEVEYLQLVHLYRDFFAAELEMICSQPEYWQRVSILFCGVADFAVYGSWDALIAFAREIQRLFQRFAEANLKELAGAEGKSITMALEIGREGEPPSEVYRRVVQNLARAKAVDKDCIHILGRTIEWKHLVDAADLKDSLVRMVKEFDVPAGTIRDMQSIYRETQGARAGRRSRLERPWRYHRRVNRVLDVGRGREWQKLRTGIVADLIGKNPTNVKLRPSGRVALEWARLATETDNGSQAR